MKESPLFWPAAIKNDTLWVLDETQIPQRKIYLPVKNTKEAVKVIREMKTRAFGQFLVVLNTFLLELNRENNGGAYSARLLNRLEKTAILLNNSRPTFPFSEVTSIVVGWAKKAYKDHANIREYVSKHIEGYLRGIRFRRQTRVQEIASVIRDKDCILTHCNVSGELAMAAALCQEQNKDVHFFATETRPYFQGAKLTVWELKKMGADVTLVCDNAVGTLMADRMINKVIVGSDRSCANGDFANKIGTYQIAVLAKHYKIPFFVLTQPSTKIKSGKDIPIELRKPNELLTYEGTKIHPHAVNGFYPGFDIVPHELVSKSIPIQAY
ncbi:MAG: S-methyl-5-thioribose-1-phosphate isomerase [Candidatus Omnitrophica bacterium]|nr:S-methyl-5-thioribose-1-phosphate isomerase [Candidatus Omnitrophota bacterium]